jgi:hypothetical protein
LFSGLFTVSFLVLNRNDFLSKTPDRRQRTARSIYNLHFDIVHGCQLRCTGCPNSTLQPKIKRISVEDFNACQKRWNNLLLPRGWTPEFRGWMNLPEAKAHPSGRLTRGTDKACFFMAGNQFGTDYV